MMTRRFDAPGPAAPTRTPSQKPRTDRPRTNTLTAFVAAGLPTDRFFFEGFLPQKAGARRNRLEALVQVPGTLVLFESPHRLPEMLADAAAVLGPDRPAAVTRELTKLYETVRRDTVGSLSERFGLDGAPKGAIVV